MIAAASRTFVRTRITESAAMAAGLATAAPPMTKIARAARPRPPPGRHPGQCKPLQPMTALFLACFGLPVQLTVGAGAELAGRLAALGALCRVRRLLQRVAVCRL